MAFNFRLAAAYTIYNAGKCTEHDIEQEVKHFNASQRLPLMLLNAQELHQTNYFLKSTYPLHITTSETFNGTFMEMSSITSTLNRHRAQNTIG